MGAIELQHRPLYGIGTVSRLTGIKPDTLRIWERRYQLGPSRKSASGRRQYTQADLEHLQLVAALVESGTRIGEIASSERRTLEVMLRTRNNNSEQVIPEPKPRVLFVGEELCDWLEEHQGCLVSVDALLARCPLAELDGRLLEDIESADAVVAACGGMDGARLEALDRLAGSLDTTSVLVLTGNASGRWRDALRERGYECADFPPEPAFLAFHLARSVTEKAAGAGSGHLGELVAGRPRLFSDSELSAARELDGGELQCGCPQHLTELVRALASFEEDSANCSVENWQDASVHACVYAYAGQARWLLERALGLVVDAHRPAVPE